MGRSLYPDYHRPTQIAIMANEGLDLEEMAYQVTVMDAQYEMGSRFHLTKLIFRRLRWIRPIRHLLEYWREYEECYVWTAEREANEEFLQAPKLQLPRLPDNVIEFPGSYDGNI